MTNDKWLHLNSARLRLQPLLCQVTEFKPYSPVPALFKTLKAAYAFPEINLRQLVVKKPGACRAPFNALPAFLALALIQERVSPEPPAVKFEEEPGDPGNGPV